MSGGARHHNTPQCFVGRAVPDNAERDLTPHQMRIVPDNAERDQ